MGWAGTEVDTGSLGPIGCSGGKASRRLLLLGGSALVELHRPRLGEDLGCSTLNYASASAQKLCPRAFYSTLPVSSPLFKPFSILLRWCSTTIITNSARSIRSIKFSQISIGFLTAARNCSSPFLFHDIIHVFQAFLRSK